MKVDRKGRLVLRKEILGEAAVQTPCTMLATPKGDGTIELKAISADLSRAQKIGAAKLAAWKEEEHRGEKLLMEMMRGEVARHRGTHRSYQPAR